MEDKKPEVLSVSELKGLKEEKHELESELKAAENPEYGKGTAAESRNKEMLRSQIRHLDKIINNQPKPHSGVEKDQFAKRAHELEETIREGMLTEDEMRRPEKNPGVVIKHLEWERRNAKAIAEWKNIRRMLEPGDPTISNIERLRKR